MLINGKIVSFQSQNENCTLFLIEPLIYVGRYTLQKNLGFQLDIFNIFINNIKNIFLILIYDNKY